MAHEAPITLSFRDWAKTLKAVTALAVRAHENDDIVGALYTTLALHALLKTHGVPRPYRRAVQRYWASLPREVSETLSLADELPALKRLYADVDRAYLRWRDAERARRQA